MRDRFGIFGTVTRIRKLSLLLIMMLRIPNTQLPPNADTTNIDLSAWILALFITQMYKQWWEEWKEHLFGISVLTYHGMIVPNYKVPDNTVSLRPISQFLCYL